MKWSFERTVLLVTALLILVCLVLTFWQRSVANELQGGLQQAERQMTEMGQMAQETFNLHDELDKDGLSNSQPFAYIEEQMVGSRIGKKFKIQSQDGTKGDGWQDSVYNISPTLNEHDFTRQQIGTFLIYLEANTTRMKVSRIRLDKSTRKGAGNDDWKLTLTVTDRQPAISES